MPVETPEFNPTFVAAFNALNSHCGNGATVGSGFRTRAEQEALLYKRAQGILVADPGTSRHEGNHGGAYDLEYASDDVASCMHENANRFGLGFDVPGEPWHVQLSAEGEAALEDGTFADRFGVSADGEATLGEEAQPEAEPESLGDRWNRMVFGEQPEDVDDVVAARRDREGSVGAPERRERPEAAAATPGGGFVSEASAGMAPTDEAMNPVDVAKVLANAGFKGDALVTALAIAYGESGLDPDVPGDTTITGGRWGPSLGLMQIRSHEEGGWRDASQLTDPVFNAKAAFAISNGGTDFGLWTVFSAGIYKKFVEQAKAAVAQLGGETTFVPDPSGTRRLPAAREWDPDDEEALLRSPIPDAEGDDAALIGEMAAPTSGAGLLSRLGITGRKKDEPSYGDEHREPV